MPQQQQLPYLHQSSQAKQQKDSNSEAFQDAFVEPNQKGPQTFESQIQSSMINLRGRVPQLTPGQAKQVYFGLKEKKESKRCVNKKNWKVDEIALLVFLAERYSLKNKIPKVVDFSESVWAQISQYIPGRSAENCKYKVLSLTAPTITNLPWQASERESLIHLIEQENHNWNRISQRLYEVNAQKIYRTSKQCREHYMCFLKPNLKKQAFCYQLRGQWTESEDYKLICLFLQYGRKWSKIMKFIEGRNENSIKNRFFLIFENKGKISNNSDLVRKVKRKKEKLQKSVQKGYNFDSAANDRQDPNLKQTYQSESMLSSSQTEQKLAQFSEQEVDQKCKNNCFMRDSKNICSQEDLRQSDRRKQESPELLEPNYESTKNAAKQQEHKEMFKETVCQKKMTSMFSSDSIMHIEAKQKGEDQIRGAFDPQAASAESLMQKNDQLELEEVGDFESYEQYINF